MNIKNKLLSATAALAICLGASASFADVLKIGVLAPLTGASAADGQEMVRGIELAVKELNDAGGVAGHTFEVVVADVQDRANDSVATGVERLLGQRELAAVMSGYASNSNFEIELFAEQDMIYLIGAQSSQTEEIVAPSPEDFMTIWSLTPSFAGYETGVLPVVEALDARDDFDLPNKKLAIIASDNPYSRGIAEGIVSSFSDAGWEITRNELLPDGEINDWRGFLSEVRQDPPALLINTDYRPGNAATFMAQFQEDPTNSLVFIQYAPSVPEFIALTKDQSNGVLYNLLGGILNSPKNPRAAEVMDKFEAEYGVETGTYGAMMYEAVYLYANALEANDGDWQDHQAIGALIGQSEQQTAIGKLAFDPATHLALQSDDHVPLQFYQIIDGARVLISPDQYATGSFAKPAWMD